MVHIAINHNYTNKLPVSTSREVWRDFNGSFTNHTVPPFLFMHYIRKGHPYSTQHVRYRKADNFKCAQHLATDHDTGDKRSSFQQLLKDPFVQKFAYALHATPSHTKDKPRTRVIYLLDMPVWDKNGYVLMALSLVRHFRSADQTTKDACRFFFGSKNNKVKILGNVLPIKQIAELLVKPYVLEQKKKACERPKIQPVSPDNDTQIGYALQSQLNKVLNAPDGQKYNTLLSVGRTLGGYVAAGYFDRASVEVELKNTIQQRDIRCIRTAEIGIRNSLNYGMSQPLPIPLHDDGWGDLGL